MEEPDSTSQPPSSSLFLPEGKDYHAFICFNIADQEWVDKTIAYLESPEIGFKCIDHRRDFIPGKTVFRNIEEFIEKSWKYVLVMTPEYVESDMCRFETDIMMKMSLEQQQECVIPVLLKPCQVPRALSSLTYIDVGQSDRWRERLVKTIRRTDISCQNRENSHCNMQEKVQKAREKFAVFQQCVDSYNSDKKQLELQRKSLEAGVHNAFSILTKRMLDELERQKSVKLKDINRHIDKCLVLLVQKVEMAEDILTALKEAVDEHALKTLNSLLDEFEKLERKRTETTYKEFVVSNSMVERLAELMSEFDVGYLRAMDITQFESQDESDNFLKDIAPSWAILPLRGEVTPWSIVRCPYFQFDPMTVFATCSILPDGSLYNQPPSQSHPPSDRRLRTYRGVVGTTTFIQGGVYFWVNVVDVNVMEKLVNNYLIFEVVLSAVRVFDENRVARQKAGILCLTMYRCTDHNKDNICLEVTSTFAVAHHQSFFPNTAGQLPSLELGFLLDTIRQRWTIYDMTKREEITTVEDIDDVEEFTPMFGVFARSTCEITLSLLTGQDLKIWDDVHSLIERALN